MTTLLQCPACRAKVDTTARFCSQCGARQPMDEVTAAGSAPPLLTAPPPTPSRFLPSGLVLGDNYVIEEVVGEGGMGVVYRARDRALDRVVALKSLHLNLLGDAEVRRRFVREARVMTRWSHPHIAAVYDFVETADVLALVMEYIEGETLLDHLERWRGRVPVSELLPLMRPVFEAMACAHAEGVVHRDLKPENILLDRRGQRLWPKVVDFGIAKILEGTAYTVSGALLGTWRYISPEQARTPHLVDHRADIYSLGVTLYHLIEGRLPFEHDNPYAMLMDHVSTPPPPIRRTDVSPALKRLVLECMAKEPAARPPDCEALSRRLAAAVEAEAPSMLDVGGMTMDLPAVAPRGDDGATLVAIAAGEFAMGRGRRSVWLDAYAIDQTPVTNRRFAIFMEATGYRPDVPKGFLRHWRGGVCPEALLDHPVVHVSWHDARAYAAWVGRQLPTEAQWEKAARGADGRKYPWGRTSPTAEHARFGGRLSGTAPVGQHPAGASPFGVLDMAGNVWEWCLDVDDPEFYTHGPARNPYRTGPPSRAASVVRGGSWAFGARTLLTWARRGFPPDTRLDGVGFRCVG